MPHRQFVSLFLSGLCLLALFVCSCARAPHKYDPNPNPPSGDAHMPMPRADPVHLQYLERQSMLGKSYTMAQVVSGSELAWRASASAGTPDAMLQYADNWLYVHPVTLLSSSRSPAFVQLSSPTTWTVLRETGIRGLYVAPIQGDGSLWAKEKRRTHSGDDVVTYDFSRAAGSEAQYRRLMSAVIDDNGLLGSDLIPAATGLGPDFFLAATGVREYPGIYCMVEIPEKHWPHLPAASSEWEGAALGREQVEALNGIGLLPKAMLDELSPYSRMGGWAATGEVRGVDGNHHRWVYRYYKSPGYAVLNWEDPSRTAHRILSGSAVRQVGLQGQALLGLRFEAFQGLDAAGEAGGSLGGVEPALTAAQSMSREIRRYGGWSWVRNEDLSLTNLRDFLYSGTDFIFDSVFSPAAEHALLTGDASLARFMADEALRLQIDMRRLVRATPAQDGVNYSLPHLAYLAAGPGGEKAASFRRSIQQAMRAAARSAPAPVAENRLYTTAAGLAAMALETHDAKEIARGHALLLFFRAMQPGVMMVSGQDLVGLLPLPWQSVVSSPDSWNVADASRGSYGLTALADSRSIGAQGLPKAPSLHPTPDVQVHQPGSFLREIGGFLKARTRYGIARGTLAGRPATGGKGAIALLTRLPDNTGYLLSVCNFSRRAVTETISLADFPDVTIHNITAIATGGSHTVSGRNVTVKLGPWQGRALLMNHSPSAANSPEKTPGEEVTPIPAE